MIYISSMWDNIRSNDVRRFRFNS